MKAAEAARQLQIYLHRLNFEEKKTGRLYQVELAPADDELLLWDKPLSEQSEKVRSILNKAGLYNDIEAAGSYFKIEPTASGKSFKVVSDAYEYGTYRTKEAADAKLADLQKAYRSTGQSFYYDLTHSKGSDKAASDYLHSLGIRGIKYLDGSSRNTATFKITPPSQTVAGDWMVKSDDYNSKGVHFKTEQEAKAYLKEQQEKANHNYVIFSDEDIEVTAKFQRRSPVRRSQPMFSRSDNPSYKWWEGMDIQKQLNSLPLKFWQKPRNFIAMGYVPITRAEADQLYYDGLDIFVAHVNIKGELDTTGNEGIFMRPLSFYGYEYEKYNGAIGRESEAARRYREYRQRYNDSQRAIPDRNRNTEAPMGRDSALQEEAPLQKVAESDSRYSVTKDKGTANIPPETTPTAVGGNPFKDSVVQEPLYHGTWKKFESLNAPNYFTNSYDLARLYTKLRTSQKERLDYDGIKLSDHYKNIDKRIYSVFLNIKKPFDISDLKATDMVVGYFNADKLLDRLNYYGIKDKEIIDIVYDLSKNRYGVLDAYERDLSLREKASRMLSQAFIQPEAYPRPTAWLTQSAKSEKLSSSIKHFLEKCGFDGIKFNDPQPGDELGYHGAFTTYVPFKQEQIETRYSRSLVSSKIYDKNGQYIGKLRLEPGKKSKEDIENVILGMLREPLPNPSSPPEVGGQTVKSGYSINQKGDIIEEKGGEDGRPTADSENRRGERESVLPGVREEHRRRVADERQGISQDVNAPHRLREACRTAGQGITHDPTGYDNHNFKEMQNLAASHGFDLIPFKDSTKSINAFISGNNIFLSMDKGDVPLINRVAHEISHHLYSQSTTKGKIDTTSQAFIQYRENLSKTVLGVDNYNRGYRVDIPFATEEYVADIESGMERIGGVLLTDGLKNGQTVDPIVKESESRKYSARKYSIRKSQDPPTSRDPKVLNLYLKDETDALIQTMMNKLHPPHMTWLETILKSPEWFGHPQIQNIVKLFMRDRNEIYHETFNGLNMADDIDAPESTVTEAAKALKNKGLSLSDRLAGKVSPEYQKLQEIIDEGDTSWKRNTSISLDKQIKEFEKHIRQQGATDDTIRVWKLYRQSYDKALDLQTAQLRQMIEEITEEANFRGEKPDLNELRQTLKGALAQMEEWRGFYAPRLREQGNWKVQAYKEHGPMKENREWYREHRGSELSARRLANKMQREGWKIFSVGQVEKLPETIYQDVNAT
ncbi:MAG: hypothetical protein PHY28_09845, partial [Dehalococcoidales bacterium]|nr:hypothetical protein [Dehalococcoidales bacterium]